MLFSFPVCQDLAAVLRDKCVAVVISKENDAQHRKGNMIALADETGGRTITLHEVLSDDSLLFPPREVTVVNDNHSGETRIAQELGALTCSPYYPAASVLVSPTMRRVAELLRSPASKP